MNSDGSHVTRLTNLKGFAGVPMYSPDEKLIVFQWRESNNFRDDKKWRICMMNADGSDFHIITPGASNDQAPNWSRDCRRLLSDASFATVMQADITKRILQRRLCSDGG